MAVAAALLLAAWAAVALGLRGADPVPMHNGVALTAGGLTIGLTRCLLLFLRPRPLVCRVPSRSLMDALARRG
jgi:hypothetical protein